MRKYKTVEEKEGIRLYPSNDQEYIIGIPKHFKNKKALSNFIKMSGIKLERANNA